MAMTLITTNTSSGAASSSFTSSIDSTYKLYIFKFIDVNPATDEQYFTFQCNATDTADYNDIVVLTLTTVNTQKAALNDLINKVYGQPHISGMIDVYDAVNGTGITGVSGIHVVEHSETAD